MYLERYSEHSQFQKQTDPSVSESEFNLKSFWYSIQRHNRLIVFCVLFAVALMAIRIQTQPDLFESRTKVLVENQGSIIGGSNNYFRMPQSIDTGILNQWILSTSVINKIEQILGPDIHVSKGNYSVNVLSKAQNYGINNQVLLSISAISQSPEHSYKMAQAIVKAFRAQLMDNQLQQSRESLSWMAERLAEQKRKVEEAEQRFQEYKQQIEVLSFEDQQA
ncbi:hypothetical protein JW979_01045, partial [bacterium]|nr:hypothetical protein [candidate division CSSED10-310 bacterium]